MRELPRYFPGILSAARICCVVRWVEKAEEMAKQRSVFEERARKERYRRQRTGDENLLFGGEIRRLRV